MIFRSELADLVVVGQKTATRRLPSDKPRSPWYRGGCWYRVDHDFAVQPGRAKPGIARAVVTRCAMEELGAMRPRDAKREGFASINEFDAAWRRINGPFVVNGKEVPWMNAWVWVVEFKLLPHSIPAEGR